MASKTVIHSVPLSKPAPAPESITQLELTVLLALRGRLYQLESKSKPPSSPSKRGLRLAPPLSPAITEPS